MKNLILSLFAILALSASAIGGQNEKFTGGTQIQSGSLTVKPGASLVLDGANKLGSTEIGVPFIVTATVVGNSATAVDLIPATAVPTGRSIYVTGFTATVSANSWAAGTANTVAIQDTAGTPIVAVSLAKAGLTAAAVVRPFTAANVTLTTFGTPLTASKGLQAKASASAGLLVTDTITIVVSGFIK